MVFVSWYGDCNGNGFMVNVESMVGEQLDKLNRLKPLNVEKEIKTIKKILLHPNKVYGHGVVSIDEMERLIVRIERLESQMKEMRIHLNLHDNMDLLQ